MSVVAGKTSSGSKNIVPSRISAIPRVSLARLFLKPHRACQGVVRRGWMAASVGMTTRVATIPERSPPITVRANGLKTSEPPVVPTAVGMRAKMVVSDVRRIGRSLTDAAALGESNGKAADRLSRP